MSTPTLLARVVDAALELSIVGSFTKLGYRARARMFDWNLPPGCLEGQIALVTGSSSGIGNATAAGLMRLGAHVIVTSRDTERAREAAKKLNDQIPEGSAQGLALDTGSTDSIQQFEAQVRATTSHLDILINNAGALTDEYRTADGGIELTLATHLVGPYLLTNNLRSHMTRGGRILWMASGGMYTQGLSVDELEMDEEEFKGAVAYAKAKRAQVELVQHLAPEWLPDAIMHSMHPGWVDTPGVDSGIPGFGKVMGPTLRSAEEGADTMIWLAVTGGHHAPVGSFFLDRRRRRTTYLPGTGTDSGERVRLTRWLDRTIHSRFAPATSNQPAAVTATTL